jgi:hypothetical protein
MQEAIRVHCGSVEKVKAALDRICSAAQHEKRGYPEDTTKTSKQSRGWDLVPDGAVRDAFSCGIVQLNDC